MDRINNLLKEHHLLSHTLHGITFVSLSQTDGLSFAREALNQLVDQQTLLLLSGGRTPKDFYSKLAEEEKVIPGAVGLIDERYGYPMHDTSNEKMISDSGLTRYLQMRDILYYPILSSHLPPKQEGTRSNAAMQYDAKLRELFQKYRHSVGILGIGLDGHTAGIPADTSVWQEFEIAERGKTEYVIDYDDHGKFYNDRITMTFLSLSMLDLIIVLCFGKDKKTAFEKMLLDGSEEEIPSRFYKRPEIARRSIIITDISV